VEWYPAHGTLYQNVVKLLDVDRAARILVEYLHQNRQIAALQVDTDFVEAAAQKDAARGTFALLRLQMRNGAHTPNARPNIARSLALQPEPARGGVCKV
jgi:hypothetical protein